MPAGLDDFDDDEVFLLNIHCLPFFFCYSMLPLLMKDGLLLPSVSTSLAFLLMMLFFDEHRILKSLSHKLVVGLRL